MNFHLVCGYKRSGKDTFYKKILNLKYKETDSDSDFFQDPIQCQESEPYFYVLCKDQKLQKSTDVLSYFSKINPKRVAMADMVKEEINEYFKINFTSKTCAELAKDHLNFYDEETKVYRSLRSYYVEHAMKMRAINPDHWCNKAYMNLLMSDTIQNGHKSEEVFITDWRFKNEKEFFERICKEMNTHIHTYRIFRKETDDENFFDESEHQLDKEITDFLIVSKEEDIEFAKKKFPQYQDYKLILKF
jgi:hypothetical protein